MQRLLARGTLIAVPIVASAMIAVPVALAQEKAAKKPGVQKKAADPQQPAAPKPPPKEKDEPTGRLPPYYKDVVDDKQRDKIYAIQAEYADRIERLKQQLEALEAERDGRIEAVLTPQQKAKVEAARNEAKAKKAAKKAKEKLKLPGRRP